MSGYTSILCRPEREWVQLWISGDLRIEENPDQVRRVLERMWLELEGWHRLVWLWPGCDADEPCNGKALLSDSLIATNPSQISSTDPPTEEE